MGLGEWPAVDVLRQLRSLQQRVITVGAATVAVVDLFHSRGVSQESRDARSRDAFVWCSIFSFSSFVLLLSFLFLFLCFLFCLFVLLPPSVGKVLIAAANRSVGCMVKRFICVLRRMIVTCRILSPYKAVA